MSTRWKEPKAWLHGLLSGAIGGAAAAGTSALGTNVASTLGVPIHALDLKQLGVILVSSGMFNAMLYLKKSPLPEIEVSIITKTVEEKKTVTTSTTSDPPSEPQTKG